MNDLISNKKTFLSFECVRPIESHAKLIMHWRNDPETLQMSYHSRPEQWENFYPKFLNEYFVFPDLPPLFVVYQHAPVAFLLLKETVDPFSIDRKCCSISIIVAPEFRGRGLGTKILIEIQSWIKKQGYDDLYAEVKIYNEKSNRAFTRAGFQKLENGVKFLEETRETISIHRYALRLNPMNEKNDPVFIIAEAGSNWRLGSTARDIAMAKTLIDTAAEAGVDAVKFQTFRPESIYVRKAGVSKYLSDSGFQGSMQELFTDLAMPYDMISILEGHCKSQKVEFMSTSFSLQDFEAIDPYVKRHKIASYEIGYFDLIDQAAKSGKPTIISTGAANEEEIAWAVERYRKMGGLHLTLLQCTAAYPSDASSLHLRTIAWLKRRYGSNVGLSDHSRHPTCAPIAAVALGAKVIEKHFTLHHLLPGPDHAFALNGNELKEMVDAIRQTERMLGSDVKIIDPAEEELRSFARRGIQALRPIKKGEVFFEGSNIAILRPGNQKLGIYPKYMDVITGKIAQRDILEGDGIQNGDWNENK
jgi:sialic acid synthase SpsE/RimJ/RimL family protein N-acetyltransferase